LTACGIDPLVGELPLQRVPNAGQLRTVASSRPWLDWLPGEMMSSTGRSAGSDNRAAPR